MVNNLYYTYFQCKRLQLFIPKMKREFMSKIINKESHWGIEN